LRLLKLADRGIDLAQLEQQRAERVSAPDNRSDIAPRSASPP